MSMAAVCSQFYRGIESNAPQTWLGVVQSKVGWSSAGILCYIDKWEPECSEKCIASTAGHRTAIGLLREAEPETSAHKAPSWANVSGKLASPGPRGYRRQATEVGEELATCKRSLVETRVIGPSLQRGIFALVRPHDLASAGSNSFPRPVQQAVPGPAGVLAGRRVQSTPGRESDRDQIRSRETGYKAI
ncbi:hypothetical protein Bbelb_056350 [Branchiostoma belcheri]|nr:hypothetical protein Bbelb_056350 [Branchiostoma belcheri]